MKLDKQTLKKIIIESLQEMDRPEYSEETSDQSKWPEPTEITPEDITPESFNQLKMSVEEIKEMLKQLTKREEQGV